MTDKRWQESKKFAAMLAGMIAIFAVLLLATALDMNRGLAIHGMDLIVGLVFALILGQGVQDVMKVFKGGA